MDLGASALSIADICIKYGTLLIRTCKSYKHADAEIREFILRLENYWLKLQHQLTFLQSIWETLSADYQLHQTTVLQVLHGKLQSAISMIDSTIKGPEIEVSMGNLLAKRGDVKRIKYSTRVKDSLRTALGELKEWGEAFDLSWYLIIRLASTEVDRRLESVPFAETGPLSMLKEMRLAIASTARVDSDLESKTIFLDEKAPFGHGEAVEHSDVEVWLDDKLHPQYIIDELSSSSTLKDICKLARILRNADPLELGVLRCCGVVKRVNYRFAFQFPDGFQRPQSLRSILLVPKRHPLNTRYDLAKHLAKAVMFMHSTDFVHKNIRPETVLVLEEVNTSGHWAFLTGFEHFRFAEGKTDLRGDDLWDWNIYRHPTRQGVNPEEDYIMQHDIYSLGVCLLELGLMQSLVLWPDESYEPLPHPRLRPIIEGSFGSRNERALAIQKALIIMAQDELPPSIGHIYTDVVLMCLTCLDDNNDFGEESEFVNQDGILVGVRYIEKILTSLMHIKV